MKATEEDFKEALMLIEDLQRENEVLTDLVQDLKKELQKAKDFERIATQAIEVLSVKR